MPKFKINTIVKCIASQDFYEMKLGRIIAIDMPSNKYIVQCLECANEDEYEEPIGGYQVNIKSMDRHFAFVRNK